MAHMQPHPTDRVVEHDYFWIESIVNSAREIGREPHWMNEVLVVARPDEQTQAKWPATLVRREVDRT